MCIAAVRARPIMFAFVRSSSVNADRAALGIEPRTSRTRSENHTTRPSSQLQVRRSVLETAERSRRSMYTSIATEMPRFALSLIFVANGLSSELTFQNVERDRASNHVVYVCGHNTVHSRCVMCVCAKPPRQLRSPHATPRPRHSVLTLFVSPGLLLCS